MSGIDAAIARVEAIESRIVSLDPVARAAAAQAPTETSTAAGAASAATFAGVLEAAQAASGAAITTPSTTPDTVSGAVADPTTSSGGADLVAALQTLFAAGSTDSAALGGTPASLRKIIEMAG